MLGEGAILWIMRVMIDHKSPCCNVMFVPRTFRITPRPTPYIIYHRGYWAAVENNPATVYAQQSSQRQKHVTAIYLLSTQ